MASFKVITSVPNRNCKHIFYRIQVLTYTRLIGMWWGLGDSLLPIAKDSTASLSLFMEPVICYSSSYHMLLVLNPLMASLAEVILKLWLEDGEKRAWLLIVQNDNNRYHLQIRYFIPHHYPLRNTSSRPHSLQVVHLRQESRFSNSESS